MSEALGERIRNLRLRRGLSQADLTEGLPLAPSYVSLIERGHRRPSHQVLALIADRLGCTVEYLVSGREGPGARELEVELRFAELALRSGDTHTARDRFARVLEDARELNLVDIVQDAEWGLSRALEALGDLESAVGILESLSRLPALQGSFSRVALARRLARVYLDLGEPARAAEVAEAGSEASAGQPWDRDEEMELAATLVACLYEKGELTRAYLMARELVERAEDGGSYRARAAAYWEAAIVAERRGELRNALLWSERALALYSESDNVRAVANLRFNCAWIMLRCPEPDVPSAEQLLRRAVPELEEVGTPVERARAWVELSACLLLRHDIEGAVDAALCAVDRLAATRCTELALAKVALASAQFARNDSRSAVGGYTEAAALLRELGNGPATASVWRQVADGFLEMGLLGEAVSAYRQAADAAGLRPTPTVNFTTAQPRH